MDVIDQIKNSITIPDLCYKAGLEIIRNKVKSIYKQEKTPSLHIYPDGKSYHDFSSGKGGDVIEFYQQLYNLDKGTAIKELKLLAGISNDFQSSDHKPVQLEKLETFDYLKALSNEEKYFYEERAALSNDQQALSEVRLLRLHRNQKIFWELFNYCSKYDLDQHFLDYIINDRKIKIDTLVKFKLFYIGNYFEVNNHLRKKFDVKELQRAGLVNEKGNLIFAKHRIIIPYINKGQIIYLRARYFDQDFKTHCSGTKYIGLKNDALGVNTAKRLYNTDTLRSMFDFERIYVTEGEFDAIILEQMGLNAVAIPGVGNLPEKQLKRLLQFTPALCVDNDEAGETLKMNLTKFFHQNNKEVIIKSLPLGVKDITDFYKAN